jgi:hypothetical protein
MNCIVACKAMTSEHVFLQGCQRGHRYCAATVTFWTITNLSDELNMVCVRVGIEVIWSHVLLGRCSTQLLGPIGIPVVKTSIWYVHSLRHDVEIQCELPLEERRALANRACTLGYYIRFTGAPNSIITILQVGIHVIVTWTSEICGMSIWISTIRFRMESWRPL